jgi:uncharacterized RmlC-like cupin family protein
MGHGQMLSVSKVEEWLTRPRDTGPARPGPRNQSGECVIIRSGDSFPGEHSPVSPSDLPGGRPASPSECQPGDQARVDPAGDQDCRRSGRDQRPGVSGPSSGARALRLQLVMIAPGTRGRPHFHDRQETAVCVVSGEAEVWHGTGLAKRAVVRAGDVIYVPPGAPHLAVNRGDVTSIAVVARAEPGDLDHAVTVELPRHLGALLSIPVGGDE